MLKIKINGAGTAAAHIFEAEAIFLALAAEALFSGKNKFALAGSHILLGKLGQKSLFVGLKPRLFLVPCEENILVDIVIHIFFSPFLCKYYIFFPFAVQEILFVAKGRKL